MKKILIPTICILLSVLLIATVPTEAEAAIYHDTVRLHILAPSDSREDQTLKLEIRDRVLEKYGEQLSRFENVNTAKDSHAHTIAWPKAQACCLTPKHNGANGGW